MKFGFVLPAVPDGDLRAAVDYAIEAESAGWDAFFMWEPVWGIDPWVSLGAIAAVTEEIRLGTLLTPVSRRRPWKLASETLALDLVSNGRAILALGLGAVDTGFAEFGEQTDRKTRAELLDESIDIISGLWKGKPIKYDGKHYTIEEVKRLIPPPVVQEPRIPIWVVGAWNWRKSMQRVLKCDGILPTGLTPDRTRYDITPQHIAKIKSYVQAKRILSSRFDIIVENTTPGDDKKTATKKVQPWAEAGATWWIESMWGEENPAAWLTRIRQGPPNDTES
jgi:alkanesulfonate monooxygenase SsuD/methylene tetrahydromethanopterin reductase-like flavin-dependent oxidoreductase (luciferase family)